MPGSLIPSNHFVLLRNAMPSHNNIAAQNSEVIDTNNELTQTRRCGTVCLHSTLV